MTRTELINAYVAGHEIITKDDGHPVSYVGNHPRYPWVIVGTGLIFADREVTSDDADQREAYRRASLEMAMAQGYAFE